MTDYTQDGSPAPDPDQTPPSNQGFVRDAVGKPPAQGGQPAPQQPGPGQTPGPQAPRRSVRRIVIAIVAALAIAFCAWSMSQYVQGKDPLAFLNRRDAMQTTASTTASPSPEATITTDDVVWAIESLTFDGKDVSVPADEMTVVYRDGTIWVEQVTDDAAPDMVTLTAERCSALAAWSISRGVDVGQVVWISEDLSRVVRMAVQFATDDAITSGDVDTLLQHARAYHISADAYSALGDVSYPRDSGDAITLPDGTTVEVAAEASATGEVLTGASPAEVVTGKTTVSSTGTASSTSSGSAGQSSQSQISVRVTIDGSAAGGGVSSSSVTVENGATVYDALQASGASIDARSTSYGVYVAGINGLREKEHGSGSGWVYAVNGSEPNVSCSSYTLSNGDSVQWQYVNVTS
jgi:hypothetical protein